MYDNVRGIMFQMCQYDNVNVGFGYQSNRESKYVIIDEYIYIYRSCKMRCFCDSKMFPVYYLLLLGLVFVFVF